MGKGSAIATTPPPTAATRAGSESRMGHACTNPTTTKEDVMSVQIISSRDAGEAWVQDHLDRGHDAHWTTVGAPGYGWGTYCFTCRDYGPSNEGILTMSDVR